MREHHADERADHTAGPAAGQRPPAPTVRLLDPSEVTMAAAVLARAFAEEPSKRALFGAESATRTIFADPSSRTRFAEAAARGRLRAALPYAAVHVAELDGTIAGVAMWYPPGVKPGTLPGRVLVSMLLTPGTHVLSLLAHVGASLWRDRSAVRRVLAARSSAVAQAALDPSWYLAVLGTDPRFRGRGVARKLLERNLERCDVEGLPAWLETTEYSNVPLYERFGFETFADIAGGKVFPNLWLMHRAPRRRS